MMEYACRYAPVELFAGFQEPVVLQNPGGSNLDAADQLSHRNLCSFSRALLETVLQTKSHFLFTNCCDSMRRTCDVLQARANGRFFYLLDLPRTDGPCARERYANAMRQLIEAFSAYCGRPFDLNACLKAFKPSAPHPAGDYFALLGARASEGLLSMLNGMLPLPVQNETCTGTRRLPMPPEGLSLPDFLDWYAGALLSQIPCMRMLDIGARRQLYEDPHCRGILYHTVKFCDFYEFEFAKLQKETKLPLLKLETDGTLGAEGQLRTRVEAFAESLPQTKRRATPSPSLPKTKGKQFFAGIDSGSTSTNVVILDAQQKIVGSAIVPTGAKAAESAKKALETALAHAHLTQEDLSQTVTTGYGRAYLGTSGHEVTEITCHARGARYLDPHVRTILDIGGQDSKAIRLDEAGHVQSFVMNDKCAAGTGRFLEMMARTLGLSLDELSTLGQHWKEDLTITSMCTVFAESEVVSLVAQNKRTEDILHGLYKAVASKAVSLLMRVDPKAPFLMTGGVASNAGVVRAVEEKLGAPLEVFPEHQLCGALGAALLAMEG